MRRLAVMPQTQQPIGQERAMYNQVTVFRSAFLAATLLLMTGGQSAMSTQPIGHKPHDSGSSMFPLRFVEHAFAVRCYNTVRCQVIYHDHDFTRLFGDKPSGPPPSADYRDRWAYATRAGIPNFPQPAKVRWTSLDGASHEATVDIGSIFKDQRVLYHVPDSQIPDRSWGGDPNIYLEINDRTINVYMRALIATKTEQIPGNKYSYGRDDVILAWTHTY